MDSRRADQMIGAKHTDVDDAQLTFIRRAVRKILVGDELRRLSSLWCRMPAKHAHGLKTHSGEGCLQRQREKREGRVLRHLGERGIMSGCERVCGEGGQRINGEQGRRG